MSAHDRLFSLRIPLGDATLSVTAYDANHTDPRTGHMRIDVRAVLCEPDPDPTKSMNRRVRRVIFERGDTCCAVNRWTAIDSDDAKELVCSLLAMKPGDTDADYFAEYSPRQLDFVRQWGEDISFYSSRRFGER